MPSLDWIGKQAVVNHHRKVPYRLLHCDKALSVGDPDAGNLLVQGDNLEALQALRPYYAGKVKCIYIDPPYNTGNEGWIYNDNVNSPEIRRWLGEVVGKEAEDLTRHDKWLCMMYPRLALLRDFLTEDGVIFVSIDDNELQNLCSLMDELYGRRCRLGILVWKSRHFTDTRPLTGISEDHEYVVVYGRNANNRLRGKDKDFSKYKNPDNDPRGPWTSCSLLGKATREQRPNLHYDFTDPITGDLFPCPPRTGWICAEETMRRYAVESRLLYPRQAGGRLRQKVFRAELKSDVMGFPSVITEHSTSHGTEALRTLLADQAFSFPKAPGLVRDLILQATGPEDLVLDSFAGSGTTGEAVLAANAQDGGRRRFLLIEMSGEVATQVTCKRLATVITGRREDGSNWDRSAEQLLSEEKITLTALRNSEELLSKANDVVEAHRGEFDGLTKVIEDGFLRVYGKKQERGVGYGGGVLFCKLGGTLFDDAGIVSDQVRFSDLAAHVFFAETGSPIPKRATGKSPLLGVHQGRAIYLLFNGVLGDKRPAGGNVLTHAVAEALPAHPEGHGPRLVLGEACRLGEKALAAYGITFRQIPFDVKVG